MKFTINEELKRLIPPLANEEYKQLEENILKDGIRDALVLGEYLDEDEVILVLVDGHNRHEIAQKHNLPFETKTLQFDSFFDVQEFMIKLQFGRRNLNNYQRSTLALKLESVFSEKAKQNLVVSGELFGKGYESKGSVKSRNPITPIDTIVELSKIANVGEQTISRVKKIEEKASQELKEQLQKGEVSINQAYQEIKKEEKKEEHKIKVQAERIETVICDNIKQGDSLIILEELQDGCIDVVFTDPPYGINYVSNRSIFDDTITKRGLLNDGKEDAFKLLDNTCEILSRKTAKNAHLYFFCSWSVFSAFEAIIGNYFEIKTPIIWDKGNKGSGDLDNDWGNQTEIIIYCVKGKKLVNNRRGNIISVPRLHTSKMVHPTQKPSDLIKQILEVSVCDGDFIVDPFMGSGSTIKVCNEMGLKSLGIELDMDMFNIANDFING